MIQRVLCAAAVLLMASRLEAQPRSAADAAAALARIEATLAAAGREDASRACPRVQDAVRVATPEGEQVLRLDWLRRGVCDRADSDAIWTARRNALVERLAATRRELLSARAATDGHTDARGIVAGILAQRAFRAARGESWQGALLDRITDWFTKMWARTFGRRVGQRRAAEVLAWLAGLAALALLVSWLLRLAARARSERPQSMGALEAPGLPAHVLGGRAAALIRDGDYREGARLAYNAALARLEEDGALRADAARTPRESLRLVPSGYRRRAPFAALTGIFERVWYGWRGQDAAAGDAIIKLLEDLECLSLNRAR